MFWDYAKIWSHLVIRRAYFKCTPWKPTGLLTAQLLQTYWGCASLCHSRIKPNVRTNSFDGSSISGFLPKGQQQILKIRLEGYQVATRHPQTLESLCPIVLVIISTQCRTNAKQKPHENVCVQGSFSNITRECVRGRATEANKISAGMQKGYSRQRTGRICFCKWFICWLEKSDTGQESVCKQLKLPPFSEQPLHAAGWGKPPHFCHFNRHSKERVQLFFSSPTALGALSGGFLCCSCKFPLSHSALQTLLDHAWHK